MPVGCSHHNIGGASVAGWHERDGRLIARGGTCVFPLVAVVVLISGCAPTLEPTPSAISCPDSADVPGFLLSQARTLVGSDVLVCEPRDDTPTSLTLTAEWAELLATDGITLPTPIELVSGEGEWTCEVGSGSSLVLVNGEWYAARSVECSQEL